MCGIVCGVSSTLKEEEIKISLQKINHRGPDEQDYYRKHDLFLGHARLSIVDINGGHQPLWNEEHTICAVVNGEFYDYKEKRDDLVKRGHYFRTNSDSEMLIHLYEEYGVDCLKYLHGEFCFVLYDFNRKIWFCARDRMGVRPLQYYFNKGDFFIASEAKSLFCFSSVKTGFNHESFWFSQHLQYLPLDKTLFNNINMIKPGHYIIVNGNETPIQIEYWSLKDIKTQSNITFNEAKDHVHYLLNQAVAKRLPNEVKWASHLSGGIDSSLVTALARQRSNMRSTAFTIKFTDDEFYDESLYAQETANFLNVSLVSIPVSFEDMINAIPKAVYHAEGLSINGHLGAKYILNKIIKEHGFKVALSGEGSDEIFMGYSHLKQDYLTKNSLKKMEKDYLTGFQLPDNNTMDLSCIQNAIGFVPTWIQAKSSMAYKLKSLWSNNFIYDCNPYQDIIPDLIDHQSNLKASSSSWAKYCLNGYILKVLDDAQSMAHSIEGRLPFLDTKLIEYVYSLPENIYFHNGIEKGLLREGFKGELPESIINKKKQSFMSPHINRFLDNPSFNKLIEEYIIDNNYLDRLDIFNKEKVKDLLFNSDKKQMNLEPILMTLLCTGIITKDLIK